MSQPTKAELQAQIDRLTAELTSALDEQDILMARIDVLTGTVTGANNTISDLAQRYVRVVAQNIEMIAERTSAAAQDMQDRVDSWAAERADLVPARTPKPKWTGLSKTYFYSPGSGQ